MVACVVEIGSPKAEASINQIAVESNIVIMIASFTSKLRILFPTVFATPSPNNKAPAIARITASIKICFIVRIFDP